MLDLGGFIVWSVVLALSGLKRYLLTKETSGKIGFPHLIYRLKIDVQQSKTVYLASCTIKCHKKVVAEYITMIQ